MPTAGLKKKKRRRNVVIVPAGEEQKPRPVNITDTDGEQEDENGMKCYREAS